VIRERRKIGEELLVRSSSPEPHLKNFWHSPEPEFPEGKFGFQRMIKVFWSGIRETIFTKKFFPKIRFLNLK
jgi:hypothetical protein